jgi:hypothetical protein
MHFTPVLEGFVVHCSASERAAVGSRCVALPSGELLCSCMLTAGLGTNDFLPVLFRSTDLGASWTPQGPVWPHLERAWSLFVSISRDTTGDLFLFGTRTPVDRAGESFWCEATQGLKQNELIHARSRDGGRTWTEPAGIPMPSAGAAEAPGALCVTRMGRWLVPYSPYNTFDPAVTVTRNQVLVARSNDQGRTWGHSAMLRLPDARSGAAEAWVVELADGRLLGTCWHLHPDKDGAYANAYALSDDGATWGPTRSTGILGQSTALAALPDGRALFIYNQRRQGEVGVWLAVARPTHSDFGIEANQIVWQAQTATQTGSSGEHSQWEDFSFGEPSITPLPDGTFLVTLWSMQPPGSGIRYVKLNARER